MGAKLILFSFIPNLGVRYWVHGAGYWVLGAGYWVLGAGSCFVYCLMISIFNIGIDILIQFLVL
jgi:hypothetical protein